MNDNKNDFQQLLLRLEALLEKQSQIKEEMLQLRAEIVSQSQRDISETDIIEEPGEEIEKPLAGKEETEPQFVVEREEIFEQTHSQSGIESLSEFEPAFSRQISSPALKKDNKSDLERFIGENLINKIGIAITIIGVGIGAKYSIENELINPLTRIFLGYLLGIGFIGTAIYLKPKYEKFSAVVLSGGMATMYLITYSAYNFYGFFSQAFAFILMVMFTAFTVVAAIHYNRQVIALFGLVGAYAVPFLLSEGDGKVAVLFTFMAIINIGILIIAIQRYWKLLYYASFFFTWAIFASWYFARYSFDSHFYLALIYSALFFIIFYLTFLTYKLVRKERFNIGDVILLLLNSFIFYGFGYDAISTHEFGDSFLGLFTFFNGLIHFAVAFVIYKKKLADKSLFHLLAGLVLVFITIAIPVQLDGNWVTLIWAGQATLLFWIGRKNQVPFYELLSYPLILLTFISLLQDWSMDNTLGFASKDALQRLSVILNVQFFSGILIIAAFSLMQYVNMKYSYISEMKVRESLKPLFNFIIPGILICVSYFTFRYEIERFWNHRFFDSAVEIIADSIDNYSYTTYNYAFTSLKSIWVVNYSLIFLAVLVWGNILRIRHHVLAIITMGFNVLAVIVFLSLSLNLFGELRDNYLNQGYIENYNPDSAYLWLRYLSIALFSFFMYSFYKLVKEYNIRGQLNIPFEFLLHIALLCIASSELVNWMELLGSTQSYKLGLSILWGLYALMLIGLGIWKKKKHLRIAAISLFSLTLVKLFFYDIAHLDTIAKTVVFVSLGILLLIISFLYNKYKLNISNET